MLAGVQGRGALGGGGAVLLPHPHQMQTSIPGRETLNCGRPPEERGCCRGRGVPSWARCPLPLAGASWRPVLPCISGGGSEARCDGWVARRVAARPSLRRSLPPDTPFLLPRASYNRKGLKTEGQLPRAGTWRRSGAPLSPPSPPRPSSSDSTSRLDLVVHKQCSPILAVSGRRACARQAGGLSGG